MKFALCPKHTDPNAVDNAHHQALIAKPMHGKFFVQQREVPGVDLDQSHMWLCQAGLQGETEAALCTVQDQAMATNFICHKIYKQEVNPLCQLCGKYNKTILHISSSCVILRDTKYEASVSAKPSGCGAYGMPPCRTNYRSGYAEQCAKTHASGLDPA
eukprot:2637676-Ditylum_brightwellii.AAC.1